MRKLFLFAVMFAACAMSTGRSSAQKQKRERKPPVFRHEMVTVQGDTVPCDMLNAFPLYYEVDIADSVQRKRTIRVPRDYVVSIEAKGKTMKGLSVSSMSVPVTRSESAGEAPSSENMPGIIDDVIVPDVPDVPDVHGIPEVQDMNIVHESITNEDAVPATRPRGRDFSFRYIMVTEKGDTVPCNVLEFLPLFYEVDIPDPEEGIRTTRIPRSYVKELRRVPKFKLSDVGTEKLDGFPHTIITNDGEEIKCRVLEELTNHYRIKTEDGTETMMPKSNVRRLVK